VSPERKGIVDALNYTYELFEKKNVKDLSLEREDGQNIGKSITSSSV